jgi:hypothetical protein
MTTIVDDAIRIGNDAEYIQNSEAFQLAMSELEKGIVDAWAAGQFKTAEEREEAFNRVRGARMFRDRFNGLIENMKIKKAQAERSMKAERARGQG